MLSRPARWILGALSFDAMGARALLLPAAGAFALAGTYTLMRRRLAG